MRHRLLTALLCVSALINVALVMGLVHRASDARADVTAAGEELSVYMGNVQRLAHKLGLSIQAKNKPLADFYTVELGEMLEVIQKKFPQYDGYQIAALSKAMMDPAKPALTKALASGDWATAAIAYDKYLTACNSCHTAVKHEFVKIVVPTSNPFNQSFATK
jgi:hypothetical protein